MSKVDISGFSAEIERILNGTRDEVAKAVKKAVKDVAKEAKDEIDSHITFNDRTGQYRKSLSIKKISESETSANYVWYAKAPQHRLTHLLEKGHAKRGGNGRVRAYPHIRYGEEYAINELPKRIKEIIEK